MTAVRNIAAVGEQGASPEFDEAFFRAVDRADLARKQSDPYRCDQAHRALEEEVRLAHLVHLDHATHLDRPIRRERS